MKIKISTSAEIIDRKDSMKGGQQVTTGRIKLGQDTQMWNAANQGKDHREKMQKPLFINVPKGTIADYEMRETRSGFYHTVSIKQGNQRFDVTKKTETLNGRRPS